VIARRLREHSTATATPSSSPAKTSSSAAAPAPVPGKKEKVAKIETKTSDQRAADAAADLRGAHAALAEFPLGFTTGGNVISQSIHTLPQ
jgi:hypothetical protein